jgi:hypothetical protein
MFKVIVIIILFSNSLFAFEVKDKLLKVYLKDSQYEVVINNKAAFYTADLSLKDCLFLGLREEIKMNIDPLKLKVTSCSSGFSAQNVQDNKTQ